MINTGDSGRTRGLNQLGDATVTAPVTGDFLEYDATQSAFVNTGGAAGGIVTLNGVQTLTNKTLIDDTTFIVDNFDVTKRIQFQCAGLPAATTRIYTCPNTSSTLVLVDGAQTVLSKTLTFATITSNTNDVVANGLRNGNGDEVEVDGTAPTGGYVLLADSDLEASWAPPPLPAGYLYGYPMLYSSVTTVFVGTASIKSAARDLDNTFNIARTAAMTCDLTVAGAGGLALDKVEAINTWYFIYVIADSTGVNPVDTLASDVFLTVLTAAQVVGYDKVRWVGHVRNNAASDIKNFDQVCLGSCRKFLYDSDVANLRALTAATSTLVFTNLVLTGWVPPLVRRVILKCTYTPGVAGQQFYLKGDSPLTVAQAPLSFYGPVAGQPHTFIVEVTCNLSQIMQWATTLFASDSLDIDVLGWYFDGL